MSDENIFEIDVKEYLRHKKKLMMHAGTKKTNYSSDNVKLYRPILKSTLLLNRNKKQSGKNIPS